MIWAGEVAAIEGLSRVARPAGWVLPGGLRTTDKAQAQAVAKAMDELMTRAGA